MKTSSKQLNDFYILNNIPKALPKIILVLRSDQANATQKMRSDINRRSLKSELKITDSFVKDIH